MKSLGNTRSKISKDENGESLHYIEITEVFLVHYKIVNNNYQQDSKFLYTFIPNKSFDQLLHIFPKSFIFLNNFNSELLLIDL